MTQLDLLTVQHTVLTVLQYTVTSIIPWSSKNDGWISLKALFMLARRPVLIAKVYLEPNQHMYM